MGWIAAGRSSAYGAPEHSYSIVELNAEYMRHAKAYYGDRPRTTHALMKYAVRPLKELYGRTPAAEFGVLQFKAVRRPAAATKSYECSGSIPLLKVGGASIANFLGTAEQCAGANAGERFQFRFRG